MRPFQVLDHRPGPGWLEGRPAVEQPGIHLHLDTLQRWAAEGRLVLGGPHLDGAGGGMAVVAFASEAEALAAALADPAVAAGLVVPAVRPWLPGIAAVDLDGFGTGEAA